MKKDVAIIILVSFLALSVFINLWLIHGINKTQTNHKETAAANTIEKIETENCADTLTIAESTTTQPEQPQEETFCFVCEGINHDTGVLRAENFDDCPFEVTEDNVTELYRKYGVRKIDDTDLYIVSPHQIYTNSRYFSRLLRFKDGKQVAARTFYAWNIPYIFVQGDKYLIALNSLVTTAGYRNISTFTCKTMLLDSALNTINQREFRYSDYEYTYINTLYQTSKDYHFEVANIGFDSDDYYLYEGTLSKDNKVIESSKKKIRIDKNMQ